MRYFLVCNESSVRGESCIIGCIVNTKLEMSGSAAEPYMSQHSRKAAWVLRLLTF